MPACPSDLSLPAEILAYYQQGKEAQRLLKGMGQLEFTRTQEILRRSLPEPPAIIYDVGGEPGLYACWLAQLGYEVHLVDATPLHIQQAQAASLLQPDHPIASFTIGDSRRLQREDESVDAVLLLGPLYHLTERAERVTALREAARTLKPGGLLVAAAISRFASALDGLVDGSLEDPHSLRLSSRTSRTDSTGIPIRIAITLPPPISITRWNSRAKSTKPGSKTVMCSPLRGRAGCCRILSSAGKRSF
jgi:SAM-dependent methyltransferase